MKTQSEISCPLCGGPSVLMENAYPGYQESMIFKIYHCKVCNTAFSDPRVEDTKKLYDTIYANVAKIPGYGRYWQYSQVITTQRNPLKYLSKAEDAYWGVGKALEQTIKNKNTAKLLEVGSGLGYLTYALNIAGYNTTGLDISETAVRQAIDKFGNYFISDDLFKFAKKNSNVYDAVVLTEVIEHINNPVGFLAALMEVVKPGGRVILTTPNKSFYPSDIIWDTENPPVHCWWFSEMSIAYMANNLKSTVEFMDFTDFYKERSAYCDFNKLRNRPCRASILNNNGLPQNNSEQKAMCVGGVRSLISKIPFAKRVYKGILKVTSPNSIFCAQRGFVMCASLKKN